MAKSRNAGDRGDVVSRVRCDVGGGRLDSCRLKGPSLYSKQLRAMTLTVADLKNKDNDKR